MSKSKRLTPIKQLAQDKEKDAARAFGQSLEQNKLEASKLQQLMQYRSEYLTQMEEKIKQGISGASLQQYHQFLNKLDTAVKQQQEVIERSKKQLEVKQEHWQDKRSKAKAISQAMNNMQAKEKRAQDKKDATQQDEMSTQAFLRRKTQTPTD